jgi:hypothetical protein
MKLAEEIAEKVWRETKKKYVDDWKPTADDVKWLVDAVNSMSIGTLWNIPQDGVTFKKVGHDHLKLESIVTSDLLNALITVEKVKKVGEIGGIRVDTEKTARYIQFRI